jgi:hypothetical protein
VPSQAIFRAGKAHSLTSFLNVYQQNILNHYLNHPSNLLENDDDYYYYNLQTHHIVASLLHHLLATQAS